MSSDPSPDAAAANSTVRRRRFVMIAEAVAVLLLAVLVVRSGRRKLPPAVWERTTRAECVGLSADGSRLLMTWRRGELGPETLLQAWDMATGAAIGQPSVFGCDEVAAGREVWITRVVASDVGVVFVAKVEQQGRARPHLFWAASLQTLGESRQITPSGRSIGTCKLRATPGGVMVQLKFDGTLQPGQARAMLATVEADGVLVPHLSMSEERLAAFVPQSATDEAALGIDWLAPKDAYFVTGRFDGDFAAVVPQPAAGWYTLLAGDMATPLPGERFLTIYPSRTVTTTRFDWKRIDAATGVATAINPSPVLTGQLRGDPTFVVDATTGYAASLLQTRPSHIGREHMMLTLLHFADLTGPQPRVDWSASYELNGRMSALGETLGNPHFIKGRLFMAESGQLAVTLIDSRYRELQTMRIDLPAVRGREED